MLIYIVISNQTITWRGIMIPVYICEDEPKQLNILKKMVSEVIHIDILDEMEIVCATNDPLEIIKKIKNNTMSLYFLDIDLGENKMSGLDLAVEIRKHNTNAYIVMVTAYDFAIDTYRLKIGVKDYILKGDPNTMLIRIKECLKDLYNAVQTLEAETRSYLMVSDSYKINVNEIYYISVMPDTKRKVIIHRKSGTSNVTASLKELTSQNNKDLFHCHRSYVINLNYVKEIDYDNYNVIMKNGEKVPVGWRNIGILRHKISLLRL